MCQYDEDGLQPGLGYFLFKNSLGMFNMVDVWGGFMDLVITVVRL